MEAIEAKASLEAWIVEQKCYRDLVQKSGFAAGFTIWQDRVEAAMRAYLQPQA